MRNLPAVLAKNAFETNPVRPDSAIKIDGISGAELKISIRGMVPALGKKRVLVGFYGDQAFCQFDHSYVNLPDLPSGIIVPHSVALEMYGFAAHECAHILWTDSDDYVRLTTPTERETPLFKECWNVVEDYMIERNWIMKFEGSIKSLAATEARCCRLYMEGWRRNPETAKDLRIVGPVALTWLRAMYFGLRTPGSQECFDTLPASLQDRCKAYFDAMIDVESTADCIDIGRKIYNDILREPYDAHNPPADPSQGQMSQQNSQPQSGNGQQGQQSSSQSGNQQSGNQPSGSQQNGQTGPNSAGSQGQQGKTGQQNPNNGMANSTANTQQNGKGNAGGQKAANTTSGSQIPGTPTTGNQVAGTQNAGHNGSQQNGTGPGNGGNVTTYAPAAQDPISTSASIDQTLKDLFKSQAQQPKKWISHSVVSSTDEGPAKDQLSADEGLQEYLTSEEELDSVVTTTAMALRRALVARSRDRIKGGRSDGHLDHRRLVNATLGIQEVYAKKVLAERIDTAVEIVVDCSGSMTRILPVCRQLAITLHKALYGTEIKYEIIGYTTGAFADLPQDVKDMAKAIEAHNVAVGASEKKADIRAVSIYEFKRFEDRQHEVQAPLGNITRTPRHYTPTAEAIAEAHKRLARRKERRHVMFVLTDGDPDDKQACKAAVNAAEASGVTVLGIGIGSDAVKSCFSHWAKISIAAAKPNPADPKNGQTPTQPSSLQAEDLASVVLSEIVDILSTDKRKQARSGRRAA